MAVSMSRALLQRQIAASAKASLRPASPFLVSRRPGRQLVQWGARQLLVGLRGQHHSVAVAGRRRFSTSNEDIASQLMSIPEVQEAVSSFEDGKMAQTIQCLSRAAEITESARMDQMTVLTSEALAHVYRIVGNFEKEQVERAKCVDLLSPQFEKDSSGSVGDLPASAYLRHLIQACISDITNGGLDEGKVQAAERVARSMGNITKDGKDHDLQLCSFIEAAGVLVEGRKGDLELISEQSARCEAALGPSDSLSALGRLLEATALVRAGKEEEARAVLDKAGKGMAGKCTTVEYAGVKVEIFGMLSRLALSAGDLGVAKEAASACLQAAEAVNDNSLIANGVLHLAQVSVAQNDFIVGEGLLRTSMGRLQVAKGVSPSVWDLSLLQDSTDAYAALMEKIVFNNQSRKPEGDMAREKVDMIEKAFPVTAHGAGLLKKQGVGTWLLRWVSPDAPILLK